VKVIAETFQTGQPHGRAYIGRDGKAIAAVRVAGDNLDGEGFWFHVSTWLDRKTAGGYDFTTLHQARRFCHAVCRFLPGAVVRVPWARGHLYGTVLYVKVARFSRHQIEPEIMVRLPFGGAFGFWPGEVDVREDA
jgi:hypothetical protein